MIYITGDMHGDQSRLVYSKEEKNWTENDTIVVAGDFGFLILDDYSENMFLNDLANRPYTLCFVDGNHENFDALNKYPIVDFCGGKAHKIRNNIYHLMRSQIFNFDGATYFTMGGGYSTDKEKRIQNDCLNGTMTWWKEEMPSASEYEEALKNLDLYNWHIDYIITHTAPIDIVKKIGVEPHINEKPLTSFLQAKVFSDTGIIAIDSVLNYKLTQAEKKGIDVTSEITIPNNLEFQSNDFVAILGNLLDNAIEATSKLNDNKYIKLHIKYNKGTVFIAVKNSFDGKLNIVGNEYKTTKDSDSLHGIGMKSIETTIKQYNGEMKVSHTNNEFLVKIILFS